MKEINFVGKRIKSLSKLEKTDKKTFKIILISTSVLLIILTIFLGLKFYYVSQLANLESSKKSLLVRIQSQEAAEKSFVLFVGKLKVLSGVFSQRKDKQDAIKYFSQVFGPDVNIDQIAYDVDSQLLAFGLLAKDVFTLEQVFKTLESDQAKKQFTSLTKSNLGRNANGVWQMQIAVILGDEEK